MRTVVTLRAINLDQLAVGPCLGDPLDNTEIREDRGQNVFLCFGLYRVVRSFGGSLAPLLTDRQSKC